MRPTLHKLTRTTKFGLEESAIVSLARRCLDSHPHFHQRCQTIGIEWIDDRLVLTGQLPSFYLKQLAQEAVRELEVAVVNQIEVVCCDGLSSSQPAARPGKRFRANHVVHSGGCRAAPALAWVSCVERPTFRRMHTFDA